MSIIEIEYITISETVKKTFRLTELVKELGLE